MRSVMCICRHVRRTQARSCPRTGWALNRCLAWLFGTVAVFAQGGVGWGNCIVKIWDNYGPHGLKGPFFEDEVGAHDGA